MSNWEKAQYIVASLNVKGAELGTASWAIVAKALDELEAAQQSVQPTVLRCEDCGCILSELPRQICYECRESHSG